jgi:hypothetical protein
MAREIRAFFVPSMNLEIYLPVFGQISISFPFWFCPGSIEGKFSLNQKQSNLKSTPYEHTMVSRKRTLGS